MKAKTLRDKVKKLRSLLLKEDEFQKTMNYFFDVASRDAEFVKKSMPQKENPFIQELVKAAGESLLTKVYKGRGVKTGLMSIMHVEGTDLYHGFVYIGTNMGIYFFFQGSMSGLMAIGLNTEKIWHTRITALPTMRSKKPEMN